MKVIHVFSDDDFGYLNFEASHFNTKEELLKIWEESSSGDTPTREIDDQIIYFNCIEFGDVDPKFINYIRNEIQDYDAAKNTNFVVLE